MVQREGLSLSLLVHIGNQSALRIKEDLSVILEIHLDDLVAEPKHDGVFSSHPFLYVHWRIGHAQHISTTCFRTDDFPTFPW